MSGVERSVIIRDSTLREAMDVPGVHFTTDERLFLARLLAEAGVPELEVAAPARVAEDLEFVRELKGEGIPVSATGLIYGFRPEFIDEVKASAGLLDRFEIIMPASPKRRPVDIGEKTEILKGALARAKEHFDGGVGAGFPQSLMAEPAIVVKLSELSATEGADRITIYDTGGSGDPFSVHSLIKLVKEAVDIPVFFHAHNDLGFAAANSLAAVMAGADGLDVVINGLGDRAGNASLEQVAVALELRGYKTGIDLKRLTGLSKETAKKAGIEVHTLQPIVGEHSFSHKSPAHLECPELFEPFDPALIGRVRKIDEG